MQVETKNDRTSWFGIPELSAHVWFTILGLVFIGLSPLASPAEVPKAKNVLVINSFSDSAFDGSIEPFESAVRARVASPVNFYFEHIEHLESQRFADDAYQKSWAETLRGKYARVSLDLVIPLSYPALHFALQYRDEIFPGVPIVFSDVHVSRLAGQKIWPGVTGVTIPVDIQGTINLALHLHPNTDTVAVFAGTSELESYWVAAVHTELLLHHDKVREVDFVGPPSDQLLTNVAALPPHTVVLFQITPQDSSQLAIGFRDVLAVVSQRLPTYSIIPSLCLNRGCIGGVYASGKEQTALTAKIAGRVLSGERPKSIPVMHGSSTEIQVDWRQLRRWNIPESALPPGQPGLISPAQLLGALPEIHDCCHRADSRSIPLDYWTAVATSPKAQGRGRPSGERKAFPCDGG